jgi:hypothetical protein
MQQQAGQQTVWLGNAVLTLAQANPRRAEGYVGAFAGFACTAGSIYEAMKALYSEFAESGYCLVGVESMTPVHMVDRPLTKHESDLIEAIGTYPVQFRNVHLHKGDG